MAILVKQNNKMRKILHYMYLTTTSYVYLTLGYKDIQSTLFNKYILEIN